MPRSKSSEPRDRQFNLSLTASELASIKRRAEALGLRPVHLGRLLILDERRALPAQSGPTTIDRLIHGQLIRLGNNLNQLTRRFHASEVGAAPPDLEPLLRDIRRLIARTAP